MSRGGACGHGQVSRGRVNGRGQTLDKFWPRSRVNWGSKFLTQVTGGSIESMQPTSPCIIRPSDRGGCAHEHFGLKCAREMSVECLT